MEMIAYIDKNNNIYYAPANEPHSDKIATLDDINKDNQLKSWSSELSSLKLWFNTYYAEHEQKYRRLYTLKVYCDDGKYPYDKLIDLYNEAEYKRARIQELERLLANEVV